MDKFLSELLFRLNAGKEIVSVPVVIESYANADNCFPNVLEKVRRDGGNILYGWKINKGRHVYEAIRHAVWLSSDGKIKDITPQVPIAREILFVEDNDFIYEGKFIDNIRVNVTDNPVVDDLILLNESITKLWQLGKRGAGMEVLIDGRIAELIVFFERLKVPYLAFIEQGRTLNSPCFCTSNKPYVDCHGKYLHHEMQEMVKQANMSATNNFGK